MYDSDLLKERELMKLSLKEVLGGHYDSFIKEFVIAQIRKAAEKGQINSYLLKNLNTLHKKSGNDLFNVPISELAYTTKTTVEGGHLFRLQIPITSEFTVDNFVKIFPNLPSYNTAVEVQETVDSHFKGTDLENIIIPMNFKNDKLRMLSYPVVNAVSLADKLESASDEEKEDLLKKAIDTYQRFSLDLTKNKDIFVKGKNSRSKSTIDALMDTSTAYDKFFFSVLKNYCRDVVPNEVVGDKIRSVMEDKLKEVLSKEFAALNNSNNYVIHPDLIPGNVLITEDSEKIIDYEKLSMGFQEFVYGKLLTKAKITPEQERRVLDFAFENQARLEGKKLSEKEKEESLKRYELNRIIQELFTAARYMKRSKHETDMHPGFGSFRPFPVKVKPSNVFDKIKQFLKIKPKKEERYFLELENLATMAQVAYTRALRRIENAEKEDLLPPQFRGIVAQYALSFKYGLKDMGDKLDDIIEKYDPHAQASQENLVSIREEKTPLMESKEGELVKKELDKLEKRVAKGTSRKHFLKKAAYFALPVAFLTAAGAGILYFNQSKKSTIHEISYKQIDEVHNWTRKIKDLHAVRKAPTSSNTIIDQRVLGYLYDKYKDKRTAELFYIDPKITLEAIWESGSVNYDDFEKYISEHHSMFWGVTISQLTGEGLWDNWALTYSKKEFDEWYSQEVGAARKEYNAWVKGGRKPRSQKIVHDGIILELNPELSEPKK